jgi:hypothetical protein
LNFLQNFDDLSLDRPSSAERNDVIRVFSPDETMRICESGVRRRLASIFDGHLAQIGLALSLLFSLHNGPLIMYDDEIGMATTYLLYKGATLFGRGCSALIAKTRDALLHFLSASFILLFGALRLAMSVLTS